MDRWKGRVVLVTGASAGIGAGICRELVKYEMVVVGCARRVQKIRDISEENEVKSSPGRLVAIKCDLTKESDILAMFEEIRLKFGRIDVCINNAGLAIVEDSLLDGKTEDWKRELDVNVLALCICTRESVKLMKEKGIDDGQIIQINSIGGHSIPNLGWSAVHFYCGTKFMVRALTEGLRRELTAEKSHIRVASISPGAVETEMAERGRERMPASADSALGSSTQVLQPKDIADSVIHILQSPPHVDINEVIVRPVDSSV